MLILPVALGATLRFYGLADVPGGFGEHAVVHHLNSSLRYKETLLPLFRSDSFISAAKMTESILMGDHFGLMSIFAAIGFAGLGVSFLSARLLTALVGTLTLFAAYFMGRTLEDQRTGLLLTFLLAVSPWHLTVSRYSDLEHVLSPLQLVLTLGLYGAAIRSGRPTYYAFAAVALGFSWYVYAPNQVLLLVLPIHLAAMLVFRQGFFRQNWWKLGVFTLLFLAVGGGPILALVRGHRPTTAGYDAVTVSLGNLLRYGHMLAAAGRQLFVRVDDPWFGKPGGGLSLTEATLLVPGLFLYAGGFLRPARRWTPALILLAVPVSMIPGVLAPDESFRRFYPTATLALFIAAAMLSRSFEALRHVGLARRPVAAGGLALLVALTAVNTDIYFSGKSTIGTEEGALFLTEIAKRVDESFGKEFVYVCGPPGPAELRSDYYSFIRFATYHEHRELEQQGGAPEDRYGVIVPGELLWVLTDPRSINGMTRFLAEEELVRRTSDGVNIRAAICAAYPDAEERVYRGRRGQIVLRSWRISRTGAAPAMRRTAPSRPGNGARRNRV
jgi:Dolichyl-phosphate-mannose-protein mannosyltransferase